LKKLKSNISQALDFDEEDDVICEIGKFLFQLGLPKKPASQNVRDIMDYMINMFEGCKAYGDLEYEVWKQYYAANSLIEEREEVRETLRLLRR